MDAFPAAIVPFLIAANFHLKMQVVPRKSTLLQMSWAVLAIAHIRDNDGPGGDNEKDSRSGFDGLKIRDKEETRTKKDS